jgi:hypothetical protein
MQFVILMALVNFTGVLVNVKKPTELLPVSMGGG